MITLLCWALECPSPYTTRLQRQAEEKALVDSPPLSKRQELGPQGKHLCQGQEARPRLGKRGAGGGCGPTPGSWLGLLPPSLRQALQGAAWWGKGGGRQGEAGCRGAILLGREIKRNIKRSPRVYGEEPGGLNSLPAGRGDKKADSSSPPLTRVGSQWLPVGLRRLGFIYLLGGERTLLPPSVPTPCSKHALLLVTEVLLSPMESSLPASVLSAAARKGCSPSTPPNLVPCCWQ